MLMVFRVRSTSFRSCYHEKVFNEFAIHETHLLPNVVINFCNFVTYRQGRIGGCGGGVTVLVKRSVVPMSAPQSVKAVGSPLCMADQGSVSVITLYKSPWKLLPPPIWTPFLCGPLLLFCAEILIASTFYGTAEPITLMATTLRPMLMSTGCAC
jgi:hypothetical protein